MCRSLTSQQGGSQRRKKSRLSTGGSEDQKKSNSLLSAFQMYSPFSSKENLQSSEEVPDLQVIDTQPGHSIEVPLYQADFNPINPILEEETAEIAVNKRSDKGGGDGAGAGAGPGASGHKGKGDGGGNRLKRNIKHTGSLIVRKLTSARQGDTDKKGGATGKKDKEQQETAGTDKEKPSNSKPEGKVAMLRTTTL
ncbi:hypothetical protein KR054_010936 [Drosophila jambulina]|nr:hypothetical protein KR054_010936 [Drosophila jambulina]